MTDCVEKRILAIKWLLFLLILFASVVNITGCIKVKSPQPQPSSNHKFDNQKEKPEDIVNGGNLGPIKDMVGDFYEISGWVNENRILYITNMNGGARIYLYDFAIGASKLFYESEHPITNIEISPSKQLVLIHSSPFTYQADLKIVNMDGSLKYETSIESYELAFTWNQENENKVLVSAFHEDWTYSTFILDVDQQSIFELELTQPFVTWPIEEDLFYLNWGGSGPNLNAPLMRESLKSRNVQEIMSSVHYVDTSRNYMMIVQSNKQDGNLATYTFMNKKFQKSAIFEVPQLSTFSGWLVPFYEIIDNSRSIVQFRPLESGEADLYSSGFTLSEVSIKDGQEKVLFANLENEPLSCSPGGGLCLYGYQLEKLIDIQEKEIINLIEK